MIDKPDGYWDECVTCQHYQSEHNAYGCFCWIVEWRNEGQCPCTGYRAAA